MTAGINHANVARYFAEHVPGATAEIEVGLISGGRSNLTYWVRSNGNTWVLRRPPLGHLLPTAHDMTREFKVLSGMAKTDVPAPRPIALCEDPSVNDVPFYVMEYFDGVVIGEVKLEGYAETVPERHAMSHAMIQTLVKLHGVDYNAVGLGEFGRPEGFLSRQVRRWGEQWERSKTRELDTVSETIHRLNIALPQSPAPTVVHGDYRLGNMILARDDPGKVLAVLDWEMATLGDPLTDLGYTLVFWGQPGDSEIRLEATLGGDITAEGGFLCFLLLKFFSLHRTRHNETRPATRAGVLVTSFN